LGRTHVTTGLSPRFSAVPASMLQGEVPRFPDSLFIVTRLKATPAASKLFPPQNPLQVTVPELWLKVPPVILKSLAADSTPEVLVKLPPVILKLPFHTLIAEFPP
jgi:hypothetical protein